VPRELQERAMNVHRLEQQLSGSAGESPTVAELAAAASLSPEAVLEAREAHRAMRAGSLDAPTHDADGETASLLETIGDTDDGYGWALDRSALDSLLRGLDDRDRTIVELYYRENLTQSEIGERLGYSQMHISRLLRHAVGELEKAAA
jgi:RNA polymerase sigma-B factor